MVTHPDPAPPAIVAIVAIVTLLGLPLASCEETASLGDHTFACATHADCGAGAFCVNSTCHPFGAPLPDASADAPTESAPACDAPLNAATRDGGARFVLLTDPATGQRRLRVEHDGLEATFTLPHDVIGLEEGGCCEDPCCALLNTP